MPGLGAVDLGTPEGTKVHSYGKGKVVLSENQVGYGQVIITRHEIKNPDTQKKEYLFVLYAHLSKRNVQVGDVIKKDQLIAETGNTTGGAKTSTGAHLHMEARQGSDPNWSGYRWAREDEHQLNPLNINLKK